MLAPEWHIVTIPLNLGAPVHESPVAASETDSVVRNHYGSVLQHSLQHHLHASAQLHWTMELTCALTCSKTVLFASCRCSSIWLLHGAFGACGCQTCYGVEVSAEADALEWTAKRKPSHQFSNYKVLNRAWEGALVGSPFRPPRPFRASQSQIWISSKVFPLRHVLLSFCARRTVPRCAGAVQKVCYFGPIFPDGQVSAVTTVFPYT